MKYDLWACYVYGADHLGSNIPIREASKLISAHERDVAAGEARAVVAYDLRPIRG